MSTQGYRDLINCEDGKNLFWTTDINVELPIKMPTSGLGSTIKPETIPAVFKRTVENRGTNAAMKVMRNKKELTWSWNQWYKESMQFAKAMEHLGVEERKAVNIMGFNSPEWAIALMGGIMHNNVITGIYTTNGPEACFYQAENSECQVVVVDTIDQLKLYLSIVDRLPEIKAIVVWGSEKIPEDLQKDSRVYSLKNFLEVGSKMPDAKIQTLMDK